MKKVVKRFWGFVLALVLVVACLSGFSMTPKLHAEDASMATSSSLSEEEMFEIISRANEVIGNSRGLPYNALLEEAISLLALIDTGVEKIEASGGSVIITATDNIFLIEKMIAATQTAIPNDKNNFLCREKKPIIIFRLHF